MKMDRLRKYLLGVWVIMLGLIFLPRFDSLNYQLFIKLLILIDGVIMFVLGIIAVRDRDYWAGIPSIVFSLLLIILWFVGLMLGLMIA